MAQRLCTRQQKNIVKCLQQVVHTYLRCGFKITKFLMDKEFDPLKSALALQGIDFNPTAAAEHVPEIEWCNCMMKET
eukprot:362545-Ditylum_brightwellii.AAC.1